MYNSNMLPTSVIGAYTYVQSTTYDSASRVTQRVLGAGVLRQNYTYNAWNIQGGRLQGLSGTRISGGVTLQNFTYSYDPVGNIMTIVDSVNTQTQTLRQAQGTAFGYDELDRLTSASASGTPAQGSYSETINTTPRRPISASRTN